MQEKLIKIQGVVTKEAVQKERQSVYKIRAGDKEYEIVSANSQAVKDFLFVRKGQYMEIEGETTGSDPQKEQIVPKESRIRLVINTEERKEETYE